MNALHICLHTNGGLSLATGVLCVDPARSRRWRSHPRIYPTVGWEKQLYAQKKTKEERLRYYPVDWLVSYKTDCYRRCNHTSLLTWQSLKLVERLLRLGCLHLFRGWCRPTSEEARRSSLSTDLEYHRKTVRHQRHSKSRWPRKMDGWPLQPTCFYVLQGAYTWKGCTPSFRPFAVFWLRWRNSSWVGSLLLAGSIPPLGQTTVHCPCAILYLTRYGQRNCKAGQYTTKWNILCFIYL